MAIEATVKRAVRRVIRAFEDYAATQGWGPGDYEIYVRPNLDWNAIHAVLAARAFPSSDYHQNYDAIHDFVKERLKDEPFLRDALGFALVTIDDLDNTGLGGIRSKYLTAEDL
jgi:hypothetical protein